MSSDHFQGLGDLSGRELVAVLASAYGRIRALEIEVFELQS